MVSSPSLAALPLALMDSVGVPPLGGHVSSSSASSESMREDFAARPPDGGTPTLKADHLRSKPDFRVTGKSHEADITDSRCHSHHRCPSSREARQKLTRTRAFHRTNSRFSRRTSRRCWWSRATNAPRRSRRSLLALSWRRRLSASGRMVRFTSAATHPTKARPASTTQGGVVVGAVAATGTVRLPSPSFREDCRRKWKNC